jgi:hypothetical protein
VSDALSLAFVDSLDDVALERLAFRLGPRLVDTSPRGWASARRTDGWLHETLLTIWA